MLGLRPLSCTPREGARPRQFLAAKTLRPSSVNEWVLYVVCCSALQHTTGQFDSRPRCEAELFFACTPSCSIAISARLATFNPLHIRRCAEALIAGSDDAIHSLTLEGQAARDSPGLPLGVQLSVPNGLPIFASIVEPVSSAPCQPFWPIIGMLRRPALRNLRSSSVDNGGLRT